MILRLSIETGILNFDAAVVQNVRDEVEAGDFLADHCTTAAYCFCDAFTNFICCIGVFYTEDHCIADFLTFGGQMA